MEEEIDLLGGLTGCGRIRIGEQGIEWKGIWVERVNVVRDGWNRWAICENKWKPSIVGTL